MHILPPEIIANIGQMMEFKDRNMCMLAGKFFACIHYNITCHYSIIASVKQLLRYEETLSYILQIKPYLQKLIIVIKDLGDLGDLGEIGGVKLALPYKDKDIHINICNCKSIDSILELFDKECLDNCELYYKPRPEDQEFVVRGKKRAVKLLPEHDIAVFDKYRIDELALNTSNGDLSKINFDNIGRLHLCLQGHIGVISHIYMVETLNIINFDNAKKILEYFKADEAYVKASRVVKIELNLQTGLYLLCCNANILPTCMELIGLLAGVEVVEIVLLHSTSLLTHLFYFIPAVKRRVILVYCDHDTYLFSRILKIVFPDIHVENKFGFKYDGDIEDGCKDIWRLHDSIHDNNMQKDTNFVRFIGQRGDVLGA
jgi:hypothetical protein